MTGDLASLQAQRDDAWWHAWAVRILGILGAAHLLAGIVFFFAYNWDDLSAFAKFALLQGGIVAAFAGAWFAGIDKPLGEGLLIAASVLTGVLFAVIGQVYQTGADAWQLFAIWAVLIVPWVLASRSGFHWMLLVVVLTTAASAFGGQVLYPLGILTNNQVATGVGLLLLVFLMLREHAVDRGVAYLADRWFRIVLLVVGVGALFFPAMAFLFDVDRALGSFLVYLGASLFLAWFYLRARPSYVAIVIIAGFATLMAMACGGRLIHEVVGFDDGTAQLIMSLGLLAGWCVALSSGLVRVLAKAAGVVAESDDGE